MAPTVRTWLLAALVALVALAALAGPARAADGPGTKVVRQANDTIAKLLHKQVAAGSADETKLSGQVTSSVRDFLDIDALGKRALADHWGEASETQRGRFIALLKELIEKNYVKALRARLDYKVSYTGEKSDGDHLVVSTQVLAKRNGHPYTVDVDYVLYQDAGHWRAYDVVTDDVGLVDNYRAQFDKIIGKDGFDGLIKKMEKKRDHLK